MYALIDGNNFYVSCERVFDARLRGVPVGILSNNDGCFVSRSDELKALGVLMGQPAFQVRDLLRKHQVRVLSSNYALYGDMSARVLETLRELVPEVEPYSVDESFLVLAGMDHRDLPAMARDIRETVRQWTGIPTCVGVASTRTLAKLANHVAKKRLRDGGGVCDLSDHAILPGVLAQVPLEEVWGIGHASAAKLIAMGLRSAADLAAIDRRQARALLTLTGQRVVDELGGIDCLHPDMLVQDRKGLAVTRAFGAAVTARSAMEEAVVSYATRVAEKLRAVGMLATSVQVFAHTNRFRVGDDQYSNAAATTLTQASDSTLSIVRAAMTCLARIWRDGYRYSKAGVLLDGLVRPARAQLGLFDAPSPEGEGRSARLMLALDAVNERHGRGAVHLAGAGIAGQRAWSARFDRCSPHWTTRWDELPVARA